MLADNCKSLLTQRLNDKKRVEVCQELGLSSATLSQVLNDKYGASTDAIERKILNIYGGDGFVNCPVLGGIDCGVCASHYGKSKHNIKSCGNPATYRLRAACRKCELR